MQVSNVTILFLKKKEAIQDLDQVQPATISGVVIEEWDFERLLPHRDDRDGSRRGIQR